MSSSTKSPLQGVAEHQAASLASYERLLQGLGQDVYRGQIPLTFDPATLPRGIPLDPGTTRAGGSCFVRGARTFSISALLCSSCLSPSLASLSLCIGVYFQTKFVKY